MGALLTFLGSAFATALGYQAVRWAAWKLLLWTFAITIFPVVINNLLWKIIGDSMSLADQQASGHSISAVTIQLVGFTGYLAAKFRIPEGVSILVSAVMFRLAIRMIPFIRL